MKKIVIELVKSGDGVIASETFDTVDAAYAHVFSVYHFTEGEIADFKARGWVELNLGRDGADLVGIKAVSV